jgi:hypothetical protein
VQGKDSCVEIQPTSKTAKGNSHAFALLKSQCATLQPISGMFIVPTDMPRLWRTLFNEHRTMRISAEGIGRGVEVEEANFSLMIGNRELKLSRFQAAFISPLIHQQLLND